MIKQLSEKKVSGVICILLMILCSNNLDAREAVTGNNNPLIKDVQLVEQNFDFDKEAIHRVLQEKLSNELQLVNKGTKQAIARSLFQNKKELYYVLLLPERSFNVGSGVNDFSINENNDESEALDS